MVYVVQIFWQLASSKHVEFYSKNKFEKLVHLFGFIIRIYHDARSPERQRRLWPSAPTQCQEIFCCGAQFLCFSCDCLEYWLIFSLASDEEQVSPYAQWTTSGNDFKCCMYGYTGPLVREFCNSLWSKANYPKYVLILGKLKRKQGNPRCS
jgi:hypothetical protein